MIHVQTLTPLATRISIPQGTAIAVILCDASVAGFTVSLPDCNSIGRVQMQFVKNDSTYNSVYLQRSIGAQTIGGCRKVSLIAPNESITLLPHNGRFEIVSETVNVNYAEAGEELVIGNTVSWSQATDSVYLKVPANGDMPVAVADTEVYKGEIGRFRQSGAYAYALFASGDTPTRGDVVYVSATAGQLNSAATLPGTAQHDREMGHVVKTGTTGGLGLIVIHQR